MRYTIEVREGYLRGEMVERETAAETREFGEAVHKAMLEKGLPLVLVVVRASRPIFRVEEYQLSQLLGRLGAIPGARLALVSDSRELAGAHEYVQLIASHRGMALRAFATEKAALDWLLAP
ncbi:MAG TPA: hypothetical protein VFI86_10620 [Burkholderiales bacterium]|nr:hypothetical protein [Burkholderiales bacterium]